MKFSAERSVLKMLLWVSGRKMTVAQKWQWCLQLYSVIYVKMLGFVMRFLL